MDSIFGYGSLINRNTWSFNASFELINIPGWVRQWRKIIKMNFGEICVLTISPDENFNIDGIIIFTDLLTSTIIKQREIGYQKTIVHETPTGPIFAYTANIDSFKWASEQAPILQSYIDTVAYGFYQELGMSGFLNFFATTQGWQLPILNDRDQPLYSRAIKIDPEFLSLIDQQILAHSLN